MVKILFYLKINILSCQISEEFQFNKPGEADESRNDENEPLPKSIEIKNYSMNLLDFYFDCSMILVVLK
jgi:hypothetical protein